MHDLLSVLAIFAALSATAFIAWLAIKLCEFQMRFNRACRTAKGMRTHQNGGVRQGAGQ